MEVGVSTVAIVPAVLRFSSEHSRSADMQLYVVDIVQTGFFVDDSHVIFVW